MKQKGYSQTNVPLPEEIVFEILVRLPVKSLGRFMCVSTMWRSIISDPHFVSAHFAHSSARPKLLICVDEFETWKDGNLDITPKGKLFFSSDYPKSSEDLQQLVASYHGRISTMDHNLGDPLPQMVVSYGPITTTSHYMSQSGGLICFDATKRTQVFNPTTGNCITFPKPLTDSQCSSLGYDPVEKKHKIVDSSGFILTLGEKRWRRVDHGLANLSLLLDSLCVDGVMHMVGLTEDGKACSLLFDVRLENFRAIPFPAEFRGGLLMQLIEFGRRVALLVDYWFAVRALSSGLRSEIKLWILDLDKEVWICKKLILPPHLKDALNGEHYGVTVTQAGDMVFAPSHSLGQKYLYLYHLESTFLRKIEISGLYECLPPPPCEGSEWATPRIFYHVDSLQSLQDLRID